MLKPNFHFHGSRKNHAAASARLCVETTLVKRIIHIGGAAASARLCVETFCSTAVLTLNVWQPPPRGCVLKQGLVRRRNAYGSGQPPPRGCVLKQTYRHCRWLLGAAAASARLCVETIKLAEIAVGVDAAASARLCVETNHHP